MMNFEEIIKQREDKDLTQYDGFVPLIADFNVGNIAVVHRDECLGLFGLLNIETDELVLPVVYNEMKLLCGTRWLKVVIDDGEEQKLGIFDLNKLCFLIGPEYDSFQTINEESRYIWCRKNKTWYFIELENHHIIKLDSKTLPLESNNMRCLVKRDPITNAYVLRILNDFGQLTDDGIRRLALNSSCYGRVNFQNEELSLSITSDVYGNVIHCNRILSEVITEYTE